MNSDALSMEIGVVALKYSLGVKNCPMSSLWNPHIMQMSMHLSPGQADDTRYCVVSTSAYFCSFVTDLVKSVRSNALLDPLWIENTSS